MAEVIGMAANNVDRFPSAYAPSTISDELNRLTEVLLAAFPPETLVTFTFDGRLRAHIDVRKREFVMFVETVLPTLEGGMFHSLSRGGTPRHPFYHRISALVRA